MPQTATESNEYSDPKRVVNSVPYGDIRQCIQACGISLEDYNDLLNALFLAAPEDPAAHAVTRFDSKGSPIAATFVSRVVDGFTLVAEDRGAVHAVWVKKTHKNRTTTETVGFTQIPWGQV